MKLNIAKIIKTGGVGIIPTDTLYGLVGLALAPVTVARIQQLKGRSAGKPFIVLISSWQDLDRLDITIDAPTKKFLKSVWPGPVSVVLPCPNPRLVYLHQNKDLAIRWPKNKFLNNLIKKTGPLVAPSANPEGKTPARTITVAKKYFGGQVDFYLSAKRKLAGQPSTLVDFKNNRGIILRRGAEKIKRWLITKIFRKLS